MAVSPWARGVVRHGREDAAALAALAALALLASVPFLVWAVPVGDDVSFQLARIEGIAQGLRAGEFPVRMQSVQLRGFGYPNGVCYGDALLYPFAAMRLLGMPLEECWRSMAVATNLLTASLAYASFRRLACGSLVPALLGAALWTLSPYRLFDMYVRAAVGEYLALALLPVVAYGFFSVFARGRAGASPLGWLWLSLGMAGVVVSHVLTTALVLMALVPLGMVGLVVADPGTRFRAVRDCALAALACALVSAGFLLPFLDYYLNVPLAVTSAPASEVTAMVLRNVSGVSQILEPLPGFAFAGSSHATLGLAIAVAAVAAFAAALTGAGGAYPSQRVWGGALVIIGLLMLLSATHLFPWNAGSEGDALSQAVARLSVIQFPWRMIGPASFLFVTAAVVMWPRARREPEVRGRRGRAGDGDVSRGRGSDRLRVPARLLAALLVALSCVEGAHAAASFVDGSGPQDISQLMVGDGTGRFAGSIGVGGEYLMPDVLARVSDANKFKETLWDGCKEDGSAMAAGYAQSGSTRTLRVTGGPLGGRVTLPMLWYPQYEAEASGGGSADIRLVRTEEGFGALEVPPGADADVTVRFVEPLAWRVSEVVSVLSLAAILTLLGRVAVDPVRSHGARPLHPHR